MDGRRWEALLGQLERELQCVTCKRAYARAAMTLAGARDGYHFVRCHCGPCGSDALAVIIVRELVAALAVANDEAPPLSEDDVLDAAALMHPVRVTLRDLGLSG